MPDTVVATRLRESFRYTCEISKPFGDLDDIIKWCKTEMRGEWRWSLIEPSSDIRPGRYGFYFDQDRDFCTFSMRWR